MQEKILSAARELFIEYGYDAVSLRKIAEAIDYTAPALYTHFKDKTELLRELCRRDFASLSQRFFELTNVTDPLARIIATGQAYVRFALEHPNHYRLMFMTPKVAEIEPSAEDFQKRGDPEQDGYAFLNAAVSEALRAGRFLAELTDPELITQVLWSGMHGVASLQITHSEDKWVELRPFAARVRLMIHAQLRGMLRNPEELTLLEAPASEGGSA